MDVVHTTIDRDEPSVGHGAADRAVPEFGIYSRGPVNAAVRRDRKNANLNVKFDAQLPDGWFYSNSEESDLRHTELLRELAAGHPLFGTNVNVVAHREGSDDILCQHHADPARLTVVHLTWRGGPEIAPRFPIVECDGTIQDFYNYERRFGIEC
jgi:hypothetical protein